MSIIAARAIGELPLSIASSIALESLLGIKCDDRKFDRISGIEGLWINIRTLVRNLLQSIEGDSYLDADESDLLSAISEEVLQIQSITKGYSDDLKVLFYSAQHQRLHADFPHASFKVPTTANQIFFKKALDTLTERLSKQLRSQSKIEYRHFHHLIDGQYPYKVALISHQPIDLLSYYQFRNFGLLESHTGALKSRIQFYTKLHLAKKNPRMPFNRFTLQVFGDNDLFFPLGGRLRFEVNKVAEDRNWTPLTTRDKIRFDLEKYTENLVFDELKKYL